LTGGKGATPHPFPKSAEAEENKRVAAILEEPVCAKSAQTIEREEDELLLFAKNAKGWEGGGGEMANSDIGNPDGYQKKGVRGEAKRIVVKTKGIAKLGQIVTRGGWPGGDSGKSGVEQFEWSLITLVSVSGLFYEVNMYFSSM